MYSALILAFSSLALAAPKASSSPQQCGTNFPACPSGTTCGFPHGTKCSPGIPCPAYCYPDSSKVKVSHHTKSPVRHVENSDTDLKQRDLQQCGTNYPDCPSGYDCEFPAHTTCSPGLDCVSYTHPLSTPSSSRMLTYPKPAYCYPSTTKRDDPQQGAVCSTANSAPCPDGTSCLTPDGYVCGPGQGCFGTCQARHAPQVCGEGSAGYDCASGQTCLTIEGALCEQGLACFGYCTPLQ